MIFVLSIFEWPFYTGFISMGKRELITLLCLSSWCLMIVVWLFLTMPWVCLQFVIVVFPDHTHFFFMPPKELWEAYSNRTVRPFVRPSVRPAFVSGPYLLYSLGIPNLVSGYILGWRSVAYHFWVTVTLTSDLVFRISVSGAYLLYYLR